MLYQAELHSESTRRLITRYLLSCKRVLSFFYFFRVIVVKKKIFAGVALAVMIGVGGYVYWNEKVQNEESSSSSAFFAEELDQADTY